MATLGFPSRGLAAVTALAALAACADRPDPTAPALEPAARTATSAPSDSVAPPPATLVYGGEQEYDEIAAQVPGYAGHYFDDRGDRVVLLTDLTQQQLALKVIDARPQPERTDGETRTGATRFVQVRYDWPTLRDWRNRASDPVLNVKGAVFIDADEGANVLRVGVVDAAAQAGVQSQLTALRIPASGAVVEITGQAEAHQTLQNFFNPKQSGYQIQNPAGAASNCSLGPLVWGGPFPAYFTASHCTQVFWANSGTSIFQHIVGAPFLVGPEINDPPGWACGFPWVCRWSDAARIRVNAGVPFANQIARTPGPAINWAASPINTAGIAPFNVLGPPQWWPLLNQWVDKVGRTTGWNRGQVTHTCVNVNGAVGIPAFRRVMCQYYARYGSAPGDSGAPVFLWLGGLNTRVTGVNWGFVNTTAGPRAIFSPAGGVAADGV